MQTVYRVNCTKDQVQIEGTQCETFGYPHRDIDGHEMYENTHFKTKEEAWETLMAERYAGVELSSYSVEAREQDLRNAKEHLCHRTILYVKAKENYKKFINSKTKQRG